VVSAVGHETDVTISDLIADLRAPTPSAAAEAVVPDGATMVETLRRAPTRLGRALAGATQRRRASVEQRVRLLERRIERRLGPVRQALDAAGSRLERAAAAKIERRRGRLATLAGKLDALSPLATLRRGFAVPSTPEGDLLRAVDDLPSGLRFHLRLADGTVAADSAGPVSRGGSDA
jgi:exodeoxyribonuclease VII large subunit